MIRRVLSRGQKSFQKSYARMLYVYSVYPNSGFQNPSNFWLAFKTLLGSTLLTGLRPQSQVTLSCTVKEFGRSRRTVEEVSHHQERFMVVLIVNNLEIIVRNLFQCQLLI
jgi:hypothetical protein